MFGESIEMFGIASEKYYINALIEIGQTKVSVVNKLQHYW